MKLSCYKLFLVAATIREHVLPVRILTQVKHDDACIIPIYIYVRTLIYIHAYYTYAHTYLFWV